MKKNYNNRHLVTFNTGRKYSFYYLRNRANKRLLFTNLRNRTLSMKNRLFPNLHKIDKNLPYKPVSQRVVFGMDYLLDIGHINKEQYDKISTMFYSKDPELKRLAVKIGTDLWLKRKRTPLPKRKKRKNHFIQKIQ